MIASRLVRVVHRLASPARDARRAWSERASLVLVATDGRSTGLGEAAPLPGYSPDTLEEVERALAPLAATGLPELPDALEPALGRWGELVPPHLPAARHALETAALDLLARRRQLPAPALLGAGPATSRALAVVLAGPPDEWPAAAARAVDAGARCLKLKVGAPGVWALELDAVRRLRDAYGQRLALRLDANRAWTLAEARRRLAAVAPLRPEWVEEPCAGDWRELGCAEVPLALDESLHAGRAAAGGRDPAALGAAAWVLKPTAVGGLRRCLALAEAARAAGAAVVLSHTHEGYVGMASAAALALAAGDPAVAQGLSPGAALSARGPRPAWLRPTELSSWETPGLGVEEAAL